MSARQPRWGGDGDRTALVLPGIGYTPDMPLLYWTAKVLQQAGWTVQQVWWPEPPFDRAEWPAWVVERTAEALHREDSGVEPLLVGKSLGSFALPLAADRGVRGIWLTPLLVDQPAQREALGALPRSLLVGGTADRTWDREAAAASGHDVCEIEGADHSIEIAEDAVASLDALARVTSAVAGYAGRGD